MTDHRAIAQALDLDERVVGVIVEGIRSKVNGKGKKTTLKERFGDLSEIAVVTLVEVAQGSLNDSARTRAAELLWDIQEKDEMKATEFNYDDVVNALKMAGERVKSVEIESEVKEKK